MNKQKVFCADSVGNINGCRSLIWWLQKQKQKKESATVWNQFHQTNIISYFHNFNQTDIISWVSQFQVLNVNQTDIISYFHKIGIVE